MASSYILPSIEGEKIINIKRLEGEKIFDEKKKCITVLNTSKLLNIFALAKLMINLKSTFFSESLQENYYF